MLFDFAKSYGLSLPLRQSLSNIQRITFKPFTVKNWKGFLKRISKDPKTL